MSSTTAAVSAGLLALLLASCGAQGNGASPFPFREVAVEVGLDFQHFGGVTGEFFFPEIPGSGVALFDYDGDGDLDVFLIQGTLFHPQQNLKDAVIPPPKTHWPGNRLFRNELIPSGKLRFTDVTDQVGLGHVGNGMGVAVGDIDNDGRPDLYVTNVGPNVLYRNDGGKFTDITKSSGTDDPRWSSSASFCDYNRDGLLDLFVVAYVTFAVDNNRRCFGPTGRRDYCGPQVFRPLPSKLFRNDGNGRFTDVSQASGITAAFGPGLGVVCADFNGDGWPDFYVANDGAANQLWMNRGNGTFEDRALMAGAAYDGEGRALASMGVTAADFDGDGDEDLFTTNLLTEINTLYVNDGTGHFHDATEEHGLGAPSRPYTGWGTEWFDYDNDGFLDLFIANGAVKIEVGRIEQSPYPYEQRNLLFRNLGNGRYEDVTASSGPAMALVEVSRGAAFGDIDNDGDIDIVMTNNNGRVRLFLNQVGNRQHWLMAKLQGEKSNRDGAGARVALLRPGKPPVWRRAHTDGSYLSASDIRVHFGLGRETALEGLAVVWPSGRSEVWRDVKADSLVTLREGTGTPWQRDTRASRGARWHLAGRDVFSPCMAASAWWRVAPSGLRADCRRWTARVVGPVGAGWSLRNDLRQGPLLAGRGSRPLGRGRLALGHPLPARLGDVVSAGVAAILIHGDGVEVHGQHPSVRRDPPHHRDLASAEIAAASIANDKPAVE